MTTESPLFTLRQVAKILGEDEKTIFELACEMGPQEGCVTVLTRPTQSMTCVSSAPRSPTRASRT